VFSWKGGADETRERERERERERDDAIRGGDLILRRKRRCIKGRGFSSEVVTGAAWCFAAKNPEEERAPNSRGRSD
jgi:hypothetical protein